MPVVTNAELASAVQQVVSRVDAREDQLTAWQSGTPEGGPFADGTYAITNLLGETSYFKSPARLQYEVGLLTTAGTGAVATAEAARDAAEAALASAVVQAANASSSASTASTKASEAQVFRNEAANSEANALAHRNAASASASAAALSEADAEAAAIAAAASAASAADDATAAAASAAAAATFDPAAFYTKTQADTLLAAKLATADFSWNNLAGKPTTFTPSAHTHAIADVTGLQTALDGKQAAGSYAAAVHGHSIADVTGLQTALDGKQAAGSYAAASHTHVISDVTGLQAALDGKQPAGSYLTGITGTMVTTALGYTPANKAGDTFTGAVTFPGGTLVSIDGGIRARFNNGNTGAVYFGSGDNYLYYNATNFTLSGGYVYNANSFHAPIFYDSDNTNYYVDPASTTYLNTLRVSGGYNVYRAIGTLPANNVSWNTVGNDNYGSVQITQDNFNIGGATGNAGYPDSASYNYGILLNFQAQASAQAQVYISHAGNDLIFRGGWGGASWQAWNKVLTNQNYTSYAMPSGSSATNSVDVRAPVFYDSTNTAYYADPDGTSNLNSGYTSGQWKFRSNPGSGVYSGATANLGLQAYSDDGGSAHLAFHRSGYYAVNMGLDPDNYLRIGGWSAAANRWVLDMAGNNWAASSFRAPIFYDSNDTGYYVDPNYISQFWRINAVDYIYTPNDVYGRRFIDVDNQSYLLDPAGTSNLNVAQAIRLRTMTSIPGNFGSIAASWSGSTGYPTIYGDTDDRWVMHINPHISYTQNGVNGFTGTMTGSTIRFASDTAATTFWDVGVGTNNLGPDLFGIGRANQWNSYWDNAGNVFSRTSHRAPIFYDSNNTSYYTDPASTSVMSDAVIGGRTMSTAMFYAGFTLDANTMPSNSTGFTYSVNAPFTGPVMRASAGGGYDLWLNSPYGGGAALSFRTRNGDTGTFNPWYRLATYDSNPGAGNLYAAIYYDPSNTGYYTRPAGSSYIYELTAANTIYSNGWFRSYGDTGWYSQTYAGGIYMIDTTWVRVYNGKAFFVSNEIAATGNITAYYSDERLKTKTGTIDNALDKVSSLEGFLYVENDLARSLGYSNKKQQVGVSAQAVKAVLPEAVSLAPVDFETLEDGTIVSKSGEEYLTVDYSRIVPLLIEAIKELRAEVEALKNA